MSNEMATHLEFRYGQLRSEFDEQMGHANAIMVQAGADANAHISQLRLELENAEMNAKQEALAVGHANDCTCSLHVELLDVTNQKQSMRTAMSLSIRRLETELDAADLRRDEIMRAFRSDLRSERNKYVECAQHLALEESQLRFQKVRNEGLQSQLATSEGRLSEESSSSEPNGMRDMRIMGLRSELHMKQSLLDRMQQQLTESKNHITNFPVNKPEKRHLVHHLHMASTMKCMKDFDMIMTNSVIPRRRSKTCMPRLRPNLVTMRASSRLTRNLMMNLEKSMKPLF